MKAILFLTTRSFVNSLRRSVTSPKRLIGLIFFLGYYLLMLRPMLRVGSKGEEIIFPRSAGQIQFPPMAVVEAIVFAIFAAITFFMFCGIFGYKGVFKPADVETLFPTPVSPRIVLGFRLVRDYLVTLIIPLLLALFFIRPAQQGWAHLFRDIPNPSSAGHTFRFMTVAWLLTAVAWVAIAYAVSIYFHQPEERFERYRKAFNWAGGTIVLVACALLVRLAVSGMSGQEWLNLVENPWLRGVFFMATAATELAVAPLTGNWVAGIGGLAILLAAIATSVGLALKQADRVYEQAAQRANTLTESKSLQSSGDFYGMLAKLAREGKIKTRKQGWIHRVRLAGPSALLWKEYILQFRAARASVAFFFLFGLMVSVLPILAVQNEPGTSKGPFILIMQAFAVFMATMFMSQANMVETIKRVDLQKPLPFSAATASAFEILGKSFIGILIVPCGAIAGMLIKPQLWQELIASLLMLPTLAFLLSAVSYVLVLLMPDVDDPTQKGFRGLVNMLGIAVLVAPSVLIYLLLTVVLHVPPAMAAIPVMLINVVIGALVSLFAGRLYDDFNPSE
ncbi:MAG: hypothetical protein HONBIEJF_00662 [Fimbriimonadaceae bacterium]|nr:hypothetical protein [Fimbriimonadaceae bacterium]